AVARRTSAAHAWSGGAAAGGEQTLRAAANRLATAVGDPARLVRAVVDSPRGSRECARAASGRRREVWWTHLSANGNSGPAAPRKLNDIEGRSIVSLHSGGEAARTGAVRRSCPSTAPWPEAA